MINTLFSVDIASTQVINWKSKKSKLGKAMSNLSFLRRKLTNYETSRFCNDIEELKNTFNTVFKKDMELLLKETNIKKINIKDIWTVAYKKGDYQTIHHHGKAMYTGVLYYDIQGKMDGTYFVSPVPNPITANTQLAMPEVKEGTLCFFPGYLLHYTNPNQSDKDRIVVSFDFDVVEF